MELIRVAKAKFEVLAPQSVLDWLAGAPKQQKGHANGFPTLFILFAQSGRDDLTDEQFHLAGGDDIWRFRKGNLRAYCFYDGPSLVVLSHCAPKFKQKTAKADLKLAASLRDEYLKAKADNSVTIRPLVEEGNHE